MTPDREQEIERICQEVLERPRAERERFLTEACAGDEGLRREVDQLLARETAAEVFLDTPALAVAAHDMTPPSHVLAVGQRIGAYTILSLLGSGGMGEVYRASDSTLGRQVAIKVLPSIFTNDSERLARFEREARVLAALNHPNIATIHGVERVDASAGSGQVGIHALVLEVVEGETLEERLASVASQPLPAAEVLHIARQIAEALEAAHEKGIVHRDLKPANIKIRPDGVVKVLDFGLAKAIAADSPDLAQSPTLTSDRTGAGVLLGTAAYMSPEQALGKTVDKRADIWAFGVIAYEMLVGERLFLRPSVTETLAAVLKNDPDWTKTPRQWRPLLESCLEKDARRRLRDIGDVWRLLEESATFIRQKGRSRKLAWIASLLFVSAAAIVAAAFLREQPQRVETLRLEIPIPENLDPRIANFVLSPDGHRLAFFASGPDGQTRLWVRSLDSQEVKPVPGSEGNDTPFFWSHDSHFLVFGGPGQLKKIDLLGGPAQGLTDISDLVVGGSWHPNGEIAFGSSRGAIRRLSASGGASKPLTSLDSTRHERNHVFPVFLPDGRHFLYLRQSSSPEYTGIFVGSTDVEPNDQNTRRLIATTSSAAFVPSEDAADGHLLFVRDGTLLAQRFDPDRLELQGEPVPIAGQIATALAFGSFSVSSKGILVYKAGRRQNYQLTWLDRRGSVIGTVGDPDLYREIAVSTDGTRAAVSIEDSTIKGGDAIWLLDLSRGTRIRLARGQFARSPVWSPDGRSLIFSIAGNMYRKSIADTGREEPLISSGENKFPSSWSRDGRFLLYSVMDAKTLSDMWSLSLTNRRTPDDASSPVEENKAVALLRTEFNDSPFDGQAQFSPDGRWIAYLSDESGRYEVYVRAFSPEALSGSTDAPSKWLLSKGASGRIKWRTDGRELTYLASDGQMMTVDVTTGPSFSFRPPKPLFSVQRGVSAMDQTSDGSRWLAALPVSPSTPTPFTVVVNWQDGLRK